ncbi:MAG: PqqD family protein [Gammaproteobacteria bacterium]|nr:PqqD family protein [Gammaproteobacteria bacterium]
MDDEVMIINLDTGNYFSITGIGAEVWRMIEQGCSGETIAAEVQARYRGEPKQIQTSLAAYTAQLEQEHLIVADENSDAGPGQRKTPVVAANGGTQPEFTPPVLEKYTDMQDLLLIDPIHEVDDEQGWPKLKS